MFNYNLTLVSSNRKRTKIIHTDKKTTRTPACVPTLFLFLNSKAYGYRSYRSKPWQLKHQSKIVNFDLRKGKLYLLNWCYSCLRSSRALTMASNSLVDSRERERERGSMLKIESLGNALSGQLCLFIEQYFRYHFFFLISFKYFSVIILELPQATEIQREREREREREGISYW